MAVSVGAPQNLMSEICCIVSGPSVGFDAPPQTMSSGCTLMCSISISRRELKQNSMAFRVSGSEHSLTKSLRQIERDVVLSGLGGGRSHGGCSAMPIVMLRLRCAWQLLNCMHNLCVNKDLLGPRLWGEVCEHGPLADVIVTSP